MSRYARFPLTFHSVWTSLADGRYQCAEGTVGEHHVREIGEVLVDMETGDLHADDLRDKTLFAVFGVEEIPLHLHDRKGNTVALTITNAAIREQIHQVQFLADRIHNGPSPNVLVIDRLMPAESILLLVEILRMIARENAAHDAAPLQPSGVLTAFTVLRLESLEVGKTYLIDYTNFRGERGTRYIAVTGFAFGTNTYHLKPGLLIEARDVEKGEARTYASDGIHAIWAFSKD